MSVKRKVTVPAGSSLIGRTVSIGRRIALVYLLFLSPDEDTPRAARVSRDPAPRNIAWPSRPPSTPRSSEHLQAVVSIFDYESSSRRAYETKTRKPCACRAFGW